jgi:hypothetical protein
MLATGAEFLGIVLMSTGAHDAGRSATPYGTSPVVTSRHMRDEQLARPRDDQRLAGGAAGISRLSRTDRDWCRLLEVCQIFGTLIANEQQVCDLNYPDDQLVRGVKGTLSVVELKVMRQRLLAGQESKARPGELFKRLPIGYARDLVGKVVLHPDRRVCEAVQTLVDGRLEKRQGAMRPAEECQVFIRIILSVILTGRHMKRTGE